MVRHFVLTLTGPDRIGIVDRVTGVLLGRRGNVETSRMARLGGEFAVLMLVSMPADQFSGLSHDLEALIAEGYRVTTTQAEQSYAEAHPGWLPYRIEVQGADHEGIIHQVAHYLSRQGISIESMESGTTTAPVSGSPLFTMTSEVVVPPALSGVDWAGGLQQVAGQLNLEVRVFPTKAP
ncbi:MAG: ACT domain-containing protein [Isosphaeraceae bacterium]|nr:ACT domain-containing protein [Isosphaeraceae bacterium]